MMTAEQADRVVDALMAGFPKNGLNDKGIVQYADGIDRPLNAEIVEVRDYDADLHAGCLTFSSSLIQRYVSASPSSNETLGDQPRIFVASE